MRGLALAVVLSLAATSAHAGDAELEQLLQALQPAPAVELASNEGEGQVLALLDAAVDGYVNGDAPGRSHGRPQDGSLSGAQQLPDHPGYRIRDLERAWATPTTVTWVVEAFDAMLATDPSAPAVMIHDLSLQQGGPMSGHGSHQSGRDVDIMYYQHGCRGGVCAARRLRPEQLDAVRQWSLLSHWLKLGQVEFLFVDYALQQPLYEAAQARGATAQQLATWFQWPRGAEYPAGIVRHWPNHANHLHVRFRCPHRSSGCKGSRMKARPDSGGLIHLLEAEDELSVEALLSGDELPR